MYLLWRPSGVQQRVGAALGLIPGRHIGYSRDYPQSLQQNARRVIQLGHDGFRPNDLEFVARRLSCHLGCNLDTDRILK
jgi:hypothetical protein